MGYRICRVDSNQKEIVKEFRICGCLVLVLSTVGRGCPDLLVSIRLSSGRHILKLIEIKDGRKTKSAQKLTHYEQRFHDDWKECVTIITSREDVISFISKTIKEGI